MPFQKDDTSNLSGSDEDDYTKRISAAIKDANKYWAWVISERSNDREAILTQ